MPPLTPAAGQKNDSGNAEVIAEAAQLTYVFRRAAINSLCRYRREERYRILTTVYGGIRSDTRSAYVYAFSNGQVGRSHPQRS
jgi:hypothetical protein